MKRSKDEQQARDAALRGLEALREMNKTEIRTNFKLLIHNKIITMIAFVFPTRTLIEFFTILTPSDLRPIKKKNSSKEEMSFRVGMN